MMYFEVTVNIKLESEGKGGGVSIKNIKELYLVDAMSVTEAEARVVKLFKDFSQEYEVVSIRKSKIVEVVSTQTEKLTLVSRNLKKDDFPNDDDLDNPDSEKKD